MGLFDSIKKAFDAGGIDVEVDAPPTFRWSEGTLPVTVTVRGHKEEPRTIAAIELKLAPELRGTAEERAKSRKRERAVTQRFDDSIVVPAGETVTVDLTFALNPAGAVEQATGEAVPAWLSAVATATSVVSDLTRETPWFRLEASVELDGFNARKSGSSRIKNLRAGEWGDGKIISGSINGG